VSKLPSARSVLIVDEDLGFLSWLSDLLTEAGYQALPALNSRQAVSITKKFSVAIDVIAISDSLPGASGVLEKLSRADRRLRIVAIRDPGVEGPQAIAAHATLERPSGSESVSRPAWLQKILSALERADAAI
jgi:ActR/RegA family two-component response regulator